MCSILFNRISVVIDTQRIKNDEADIYIFAKKQSVTDELDLNRFDEIDAFDDEPGSDAKGFDGELEFPEVDGDEEGFGDFIEID